jgi:hypothetical protein
MVPAKQRIAELIERWRLCLEPLNNHRAFGDHEATFPGPAVEFQRLEAAACGWNLAEDKPVLLRLRRARVLATWHQLRLAVLAGLLFGRGGFFGFRRTCWRWHITRFSDWLHRDRRRRFRSWSLLLRKITHFFNHEHVLPLNCPFTRHRRID